MIPHDSADESEETKMLEKVVLHQENGQHKIDLDSPGLANAGGSRRKSMVMTKQGDKFVERIDSRVVLAIILWYFWSGCTLFLNKYLIDLTNGDAAVLSCIQMLATIGLGFFQRRISLGLYHVDSSTPSISISPLSKDILFIGSLRFATVFLGLYALKYVEVSFTETVKSTAPAFTLVLSTLILGEKSSLMVKMSILPVMGGLALCSANEAKFQLAGFYFALATNLSECLQNVLSKKMLSLHKVKFNPGEIQYFTGMASLLAQVPILLIFATESGWTDLVTPSRAVIYIVNAICFHFQTLSGYALMEAVSPVTHSVANTLKRALLIWVSVMIFKNTITPLSGAGTAIVFFGVLMYNKARQ